MIKRKDYNANGFYTEASVNAAAHILDAVANLQLAKIVLPSAIDYAVVYAANKNLDLAFLQNDRYNGALQVEDLKTIATILPLVYELGISDYYFKQEGKDLDVAIVNAILDQVAQLNVANLFYKDLLVLGVNKVYNLAKLDAKVTIEDFNNVVFKTEIETFQKSVVAFKAMMDEKGLNTIADVVTFFNDKTYTKDFQVTVTRAINNIELINEGFKTQYLYNENLDLSTLKLKITYIDGTTKNIPVTTAMINGYNPKQLGEQNITLKYETFEQGLQVRNF